MSRVTTFEVPADTSLFTPLQMQPRAAHWLAMTGWARWLRDHWVPFPRLIRDHKLGVVIASLDLEYLGPLTFFDADTVTSTAAVTAGRTGKLLFLDLVAGPEGGPPAVRVSAVLRPVAIGDGIALTATPVNLDHDRLGVFAPDEIVTAPERPRLRAVATEIGGASEPLAVHRRVVTLHRHLCEAADQWSGIALSDLATEVREELVGRAAPSRSELTASYVQPMRRMALEFRQAAFFLDELVVECRAHQHERELVFLHSVRRADDELLAAFVEWYPALDATDVDHNLEQQLLDQGGNR